MTVSLPRIGVIAVLLAVALACFAQHPPTTRAEGTADNVRDIDLAKMVLPLETYGPDYAPLELDPVYGFQGSSGDVGVQNGYQLGFDSGLDREPPDGPFAATSAVSLYDTQSAATDAVTQGVVDAQSAFGKMFTTFPVQEPTGATGFAIDLRQPGSAAGYRITGVVFQIDRLLGGTELVWTNDTDVRSATIAAANALADRMKGVLTGTITDFPAPLPPDVNCDGSLDSIDASLVLELGAGLVNSLPCGALADANQDGRTNAIDASLILQYSAGLIASLPVAG